MQIGTNFNPNGLQQFQVNSPMGAGAQMYNQAAAMSQMLTMMVTLMGMMAAKGGAAPSAANFGAAAPSGGGLPGSSGLLGSSGSASDTSAAGSSAIGSSDMQAADWGKDLAKFADSNANGPGGYCFKWVGQALRKFGVNTSGASAYMAADQLAKNPKFREVQVAPKDLKGLPAGAVVVWDKGPGHPHGHISIALGNGKEASDKRRDQITNYGTKVRVFLPK